MSKKVLKTDEGKKVVIDIEKDPCLFEAPVNPPNTGTSYTRGTDIFAHTAQSGNTYFYEQHWSMWQGESYRYNLMTREKVVELLLDRLGRAGYAGLDEDEAIELDEQYSFGLLEETA